jgi:hypothetical protein
MLSLLTYDREPKFQLTYDYSMYYCVYMVTPSYQERLNTALNVNIHVQSTIGISPGVDIMMHLRASIRASHR